MLYPPLQEFCIRLVDTVLVLVIVAGHIKVVWDGRPRSQAARATGAQPIGAILVNGKFVPYHDYTKSARHSL
jgi:hypothetical protein